MTARVIIHPAMQRHYSATDILRSWVARGYVFSTTRHGRIEVHRIREERRSVVEAFFEFGRRPQ